MGALQPYSFLPKFDLGRVKLMAHGASSQLDGDVDKSLVLSCTEDQIEGERRSTAFTYGLDLR